MIPVILDSRAAPEVKLKSGGKSAEASPQGSSTVSFSEIVGNETLARRATADFRGERAEGDGKAGVASNEPLKHQHTVRSDNAARLWTDGGAPDVADARLQPETTVTRPETVSGTLAKPDALPKPPIDAAINAASEISKPAGNERAGESGARGKIVDVSAEPSRKTVSLADSAERGTSPEVIDARQRGSETGTTRSAVGREESPEKPGAALPENTVLDTGSINRAKDIDSKVGIQVAVDAADKAVLPIRGLEDAGNKTTTDLVRVEGVGGKIGVPADDLEGAVNKVLAPVSRVERASDKVTTDVVRAEGAAGKSIVSADDVESGADKVLAPVSRVEGAVDKVATDVAHAENAADKIAVPAAGIERASDKNTSAVADAAVGKKPVSVYGAADNSLPAAGEIKSAVEKTVVTTETKVFDNAPRNDKPLTRFEQQGQVEQREASRGADLRTSPEKVAGRDAVPVRQGADTPQKPISDVTSGAAGSASASDDKTTAAGLTAATSTQTSSTVVPNSFGQAVVPIHVDVKKVADKSVDGVLNSEIGVGVKDAALNSETRIVNQNIRPMTAEGGDALHEIVRAAISTKSNSTIELRLDPSELGKLDIELNFKDDRVSIAVKAEREDALDLMRRSSDELARLLRQAGVDFDSLGFSQGGFADQEQNRSFQSFALDEIEGEALQVTASSSKSISTSSRVDIRL